MENPSYKDSQPQPVASSFIDSVHSSKVSKAAAGKTKPERLWWTNVSQEVFSGDPPPPPPGDVDLFGPFSPSILSCNLLCSLITIKRTPEWSQCLPVLIQQVLPLVLAHHTGWSKALEGLVMIKYKWALCREVKLRRKVFRCCLGWADGRMIQITAACI